MGEFGSKIAAMVGRMARAVGQLDAPAREAIEAMAAAVIRAVEAGGRVYVCGNGGSAADAQHIAGELVGRFRRERRGLPCVALTTDSSILTALGNDYDFQRVFARQVEALLRPGDVLWALSTSGNSPNVLAAARAARELGGVVIAMTGAGGGELAGLADVCFRAPADETFLVQQLHQLAYHVICELVEEHFAQSGRPDCGASQSGAP